MLAKIVLVQFICVASIATLFSHKVFSAPENKEDVKLNSTKANNNLSENESSWKEFSCKRGTCMFFDDISKYMTPLYDNSEKSIDKSYIVANAAATHDPKCEKVHALHPVALALMDARRSGNPTAIDVITKQLAREEIILRNDTWKASSIRLLASSISSSFSPDIDIIYNMIAIEIINKSTDLSCWSYINLVHIAHFLSFRGGRVIEIALQKIVNHVFINRETIYKWSSIYLRFMVNALLKLKHGTDKIRGFSKIADLVVNSNLLKWESEDIYTIFLGLSLEVESSKPGSEYSVKCIKGLKHIIKHMTNERVSFSKWTSFQISSMLSKLLSIKSTIEVDDLIHKIIRYSSSKYTNISLWQPKSLGILARALIYISASEAYENAIQSIAGRISNKNTDLSKWENNVLLQIVSILSYADGWIVESALQKIADVVASENTKLDSWLPSEIAKMSEALSRDSSRVKQKALQKIANYLCSNKIFCESNDRITLVSTLSKACGDDCLKFLNDFACDIISEKVDLSDYTETQLSKLVNSFSRNNGIDARNAVEKIALLFTGSTDKCLSCWSLLNLTRITSGFGRNYGHKNSDNAIRRIAYYVADDKTNLSSWSIKLLRIFLKMLRSKSDFNIIQEALKKIKTEMDSRDIDLQDISLEQLSLLAQGVTHIIDSSSEEYIVKIANVYIQKIKIGTHEGIHGLRILTSICALSLTSNESIITGAELALNLHKEYYSCMSEIEKIKFYWCITLLNFSVSEKSMKSSRLKKETRIIACDLVKIIPKFDRSIIEKYDYHIAQWQLEFMNAVHFGVNVSPNDTYHLNNSCIRSEMEESLYHDIKKEIGDIVNVYKNNLIHHFPIDLLLSSENIKVCIEVDGPYHFYVDKHKKFNRVIKDRFIDFVLKVKLGYKVIRINYEELRSNKKKAMLFQEIKDIFSVD